MVQESVGDRVDQFSWPLVRRSMPYDDIPDAELARIAGLSPRQAVVARLLAWRLTNREIAEGLGVRPTTVRRHVEAVFMRLNVNGRRDVERVLRERIMAGEKGGNESQGIRSHA